MLCRSGHSDLDKSMATFQWSPSWRSGEVFQTQVPEENGLVGLLAGVDRWPVGGPPVTLPVDGLPHLDDVAIRISDVQRISYSCCFGGVRNCAPLALHSSYAAWMSKARSVHLRERWLGRLHLSDCLNRYLDTSWQGDICGCRPRGWRVGHVASVDLVDCRKVFDVGVEDRRLDELVHRGPGCFQNGGQVHECLLCLRRDPLGKHSRLGVDTDGSRTEDESTCDDCLAVRAQSGGSTICRHPMSAHWTFLLDE
jgi:hypothetical protein